MKRWSSFGVIFSSVAAGTFAQKFSLVQDLSGDSFFDNWTYNASLIDYGNGGNVHFVSQQDAQSSKLTYMSNGRAIIKVDNTTDGSKDSTFGRNTVYLIGNKPIEFGSLILLDAVHLPFGCSVWPSVFMQGPNWPHGGEVDIMESVNLSPQSQYALHTTAGCTIPSSQGSSIETGSILHNDCVADSDNVGCSVQEPSTNSVGANFAANQGGVYATLFAEDAIKMWFFERNKVPSDVQNGQPNPSGWTTPSASYPSSSCDFSKFFTAQSLTITIDVCGSFAGDNTTFAETCSSAAPTCHLLVQNPRNYDDAYFEINYLRVFASNSSQSSSTAAATTSQSTSPAAPTTTSGSSKTPSSAASSSATLNFFLATSIMFIVSSSIL